MSSSFPLAKNGYHGCVCFKLLSQKAASAHRQMMCRYEWRLCRFDLALCRGVKMGRKPNRLDMFDDQHNALHESITRVPASCRRAACRAADCLRLAQI